MVKTEEEKRREFENYLVVRELEDYMDFYEEEVKKKKTTGRFSCRTYPTFPEGIKKISYVDFHLLHETKNYKIANEYEDIKNAPPKSFDAGASYRGFVIQGYYLVHLMLHFYLLDEIKDIDYFNIETYEDVGYSKNGVRYGIQMKYYSSSKPSAMEHIFSHLHEHIDKIDDIVFLCTGSKICEPVTRKNYTNFFVKKLDSYLSKKKRYDPHEQKPRGILWCRRS